MRKVISNHGAVRAGNVGEMGFPYLNKWDEEINTRGILSGLRQSPRRQEIENSADCNYNSYLDKVVFLRSLLDGRVVFYQPKTVLYRVAISL